MIIVSTTSEDEARAAVESLATSLQHDWKVYLNGQEFGVRPKPASGNVLVSLTRIVQLELADAFIPGWKQAVLIDLADMRRQMPDARTLVLRLECERQAT